MIPFDDVFSRHSGKVTSQSDLRTYICSSCLNSLSFYKPTAIENPINGLLCGKSSCNNEADHEISVTPFVVYRFCVSGYFIDNAPSMIKDKITTQERKTLGSVLESIERNNVCLIEIKGREFFASSAKLT